MLLKLTGITSICVCGVVIQPDENGNADVSDEVMASEEFAEVRSRLIPGQSIGPAEPADESQPDAPKRSRKVKE